MLSVIISAASPIPKKHSYGPKPLLKMATGDTLIETQVKTIRRDFPDADIILTAGFEAEKIARRVKGVEIIYDDSYKIYNTEDIRLALDAAGGDEILYIQGDLIFNKSCLNIINGHSSILLNTVGDMSPSDVGATVIDDYITIMSYGVNPKWGKMAFFTNRDVLLLKELFRDSKTKNYLMFEIINLLIDGHHRTFKALEPKNAESRLYI